ncbi:MAG TPA: SDR family NAD(P)-dependent oxidoreductase [Gemmatimonadaceae bacterium]|nr:SDR family NAD(P)-dependent oxidoreductase [Gemmatimonadaceae bacterium]
MTGTSSGIGRACALLLARQGFTVFAGVRKPADGEALQKDGGERVIPIQIDVTDHAAVTAAAKTVAVTLKSRGETLFALVNNAGIGLAAPLEFQPLADIKQAFEINVVGQIAVTQAFLPLLRESRGRVVNICSVGDRIAIPFGAALNGSKAAFALMSESLRLELRPFGMHVVIIDPGAITTPAVDKTLGDPDVLLARMAPDASRLYGTFFRSFLARAGKRERNGSPPTVVADAVLAAVRDAHPRRRYIVGKGARTLATLPRVLPAPLLDRLRMKIFGMPTRFGDAARA